MVYLFYYYIFYLFVFILFIFCSNPSYVVHVAGRSSGNTQNTRNGVQSLQRLSLATSICREGFTFGGLSALALLCKYWMQFIFGEGGKCSGGVPQSGFLCDYWAAFCASASLWELNRRCLGWREMQRWPMHHNVNTKDELGWKNIFLLLVWVLVGQTGCSQNGWKAPRLWSDVCFLLWTVFFALRGEILEANVRQYHSRLNCPSHQIKKQKILHSDIRERKCRKFLKVGCFLTKLI